MRYIVVTLLITALAALLTAVPGEARAEDFTQSISLSNGSTVTVFTPEEILRDMTSRDAYGRLVFRPVGGGYYYLIEDTDDPLIINKGAGEFFPMKQEAVLDALHDIDIAGRLLDMHIDIYILPLPRAAYLRSTTDGKRMFLSPGVWEISEKTVATVVTHEFGHCYQRNYLPYGDDGNWMDYLSIRGILDDPVYTESAAHMYRPSEVFAEDFRVLFGGVTGGGGGLIENPFLAHPGDVPGLIEFIASAAGDAEVAPAGAEDKVIASIGNYPNPFNPVTTIKADFNRLVEGREVSVSIYAADGSLVRRLWSGIFTGRSIERDWDGINRNGMPASSGVYFYRVNAGADVRTGKMLLVR